MVDAVIFDVFGTCVDWRSSVAREVARVLPGINAFRFADAWRAEYQPAMDRVRSGGRGYVPLDVLHLENLHRVAERFGVSAPDSLNRAWERLDPWPDVVTGLTALRAGLLIAPCSNGSIGMMARLARFAGLPWDCILGADLARDYKPQAGVYLSACAALGLQPGRVMMVAAHNEDLFAARAVGLQTAFVPRVQEYGPAQTTDLQPEADWDVVAGDLIEVAARLCS